MLSFPKRLDRIYNPTSPHFNEDVGSIMKAKTVAHEFDRSYHSSADVMNEWSLTGTWTTHLLAQKGRSYLFIHNHVKYAKFWGF